MDSSKGVSSEAFWREERGGKNLSRQQLDLKRPGGFVGRSTKQKREERRFQLLGKGRESRWEESLGKSHANFQRHVTLGSNQVRAQVSGKEYRELLGALKKS